MKSTFSKSICIGLICSISTLASVAASAAESEPAQDSAQAPAAESEEPENQEQIVVTGSAREQRRFDVSYAVNALSQDDVLKLAPKNYAELLGNVPGIHIEATGGEVQNITRVRGIPTDRGYLIFQQDGLPLYHEIDGFFFNSGEGMNRFDLMTERVEVVRGGPAPIYASNAAAIANNITVTGGEEPRGRAQVTLGDTGLYRLDLMQSGKLAENTYFAIGGFLRQHDGYRDNGFPNDKGGQIRANLKHNLDNGFVKLSVTYVNDKNLFYLPIPVSDPRNPSVSLNPFIDYFTGTMNSPSLRGLNISYRNGNGQTETLARDLANGRHMRFGNVGLEYQGDFGGYLVSAKLGLTTGKNSFDAFYSTTNPVAGTSFANSYLAAANTAFGTATNPVTRIGYAIGGTNGATVYDPNSASGLVMSGQYRAVEAKFHSTQADLSVTKEFETGFGKHDVKVGVYGSIYGTSAFLAYQDMLIEVAGKPRTLDLVAYNAAGQILGYVTDNGTLRATTTLTNGDSDGKVISLYANDTWEITPGLRLDAGIRKEWYELSGYTELTAGGINLGKPGTLADDNTRGFTGQRVTNLLKPTATNWTVGLSYDFSPSFGAYGRVSNLQVPPGAGVTLNAVPNIVKTQARQYEAGIKADFGRSYIYLTGFYTDFNPFNASFVAFNPTTGRNDQVVPFVGEAVAKGIEMDGKFAPVDWFDLAASITVADPQYRNLENSAGADPSAVNGNQIIREPKLFGNVRPTFSFDMGGSRLEVQGRFDFVGERFVDLFNRTRLPAYQTFGANIALTTGDWRFQVVGDNLTNAEGLTEGNPRTDQLSGQDASDAIYGRPLFGRNFRLIISRSW
ncbi:TonB-dependent receptor [Novosphingobium sp. 17-62-19]|uniref:TonB-dependent receptor n=1 Tax=Novosphingobium sp. 17-62-19 TaxID=1970406 RepID=UPI0025CF6239|nr:TonB-dependent receptor [Novosphingobium sp. 17-62-19]HQS96810.1 TonB-dependent receptor [Novosphingobium sp.]